MNDHPPAPMPPYLYPYAGAAQPPKLGPDDLMVLLTFDELMAIGVFATERQIDPAVFQLVHREGSPWIELTTYPMDRYARVWSDRLAAEHDREQPVGHYALWRYTLNIYEIGSDGAVGDDPIWKPPEQ